MEAFNTEMKNLPSYVISEGRKIKIYDVVGVTAQQYNRSSWIPTLSPKIIQFKFKGDISVLTTSILNIIDLKLCIGNLEYTLENARIFYSHWRTIIDTIPRIETQVEVRYDKCILEQKPIFVRGFFADVV